MTKAAVAVMVKGIAVDLAPRGITVNNIQAGPTRTDMTAEFIDRLTPMIPLKRVGDPDEIAGLVAYLASSESETYREFAERAAEIFREHGPLKVVECWGDESMAPPSPPVPLRTPTRHSVA
jgi:NAD(P)-dependent dehydrogenase (short-subunit alcohol dehydrogenase family)